MVIGSISRIVDAIREWYSVVKPQSYEGRLVSEMKDAIEPAYDLYIKGFKAASENLSRTKNTATEGGAKFMARDSNPNIANPRGLSLNEQLEEAYKSSESFEKRYVYVGSFSDVFRDSLSEFIKIKDLPVVMNYRDAYLSMHSEKTGKYHGKNINYHNMGVNGLENALNNLGEPIAVILSEKENRIELMLKGTDYKKSPLYSIVEVNTIANNMDKYLEAHVVTSLYGKRNMLNYLESAKNKDRVIYDKKEDSPQVNTSVQYRGIVNEESSNNIIADSSKKSNTSTRKNQSRDTDYLTAVENGDMDTAQRMVDEVAKAAGYTVKGYHQTARDFTVFNTDNPKAGLNDSETPNGIFFKTNDHDIGLEGKKQMAGYLNVGNVLDFNDRAEANKWYRKNVEGYEALDVAMKDEVKRIEEKMNAIERDMFRDGITDEEYETLDSEWNELLEEMRGIENEYRGKLRELLNDYFLKDSSGYDSIHLGYDGHRYVEGKREDVETYIVFKNTQVKSADPVTYDDSGEVIPLSQRFDSTKKDIRYQGRDEFDIDLFEDDDSVENIFAKEYATHHEDIGEVLKNIEDIELPSKKIDTIVNRIIRGTFGDIDAETRKTLSVELQMAMENTDNPEQISNDMIAAVRKAIDDIKVTDDRAESNYRDLLSVFKGNRYYLTDEQISDLKEHDVTLNDFKNRMFRKLNIVKRENAERSIGGG